MIKLSVLFPVLMVVFVSTLQANNSNSYFPWLVYYANSATVDSFSDYQLLVFDSENHPPLDKLKKQGKLLLGYISLGEVESYRSYFGDVKKQGILLNENLYWKGSFFVDMRSDYWPQLVIEQLIPKILEQGFDGVFLDTLDNPLFLENQDPVKYKGMKKAAVRLVKAIRLYFPYAKIMMNRGYELIDDVAPFIDMILGESVYADYSFERKKYQLVESSTYKQQVMLLKNALKINPKMGIYTLDYWDPDDKNMIRQIYQVQRSKGFIPYVSTIKLDRIIKEPK